MIQWDKFYPSIYEVQLAEKCFIKSISENYLDIQDGTISIKTAISSAVAEVWTEAKKYQDKKNRAVTASSLSFLGCPICPNDFNLF